MGSALGIVQDDLLTTKAFLTMMRPSCLLASSLRHHSTKTTRLLTTAYSGEPGDGRLGLEKLPYVPFSTRLPKTNQRVAVTPFEQADIAVGRDLMNLIIREGRTWPFVDEFETESSFCGYFLSHTALCMKEDDSDIIMGMFYIKPNYPGRCSHICNGGFITAPQHRGKGVAKLMGRVFLQTARDLGYKASYFNLVFKSNVASVQLWESLGFERVATLPEAADLEGVPGLDTAYGYRYDLTQLSEAYLWDHIIKEE